MKILLINEVCGTGSTGRICLDLAEQLEKKGHEVKIAYGRNDNVPDAAKKFAVRIGTRRDVLVHAMYTRLFDRTGFGSKRATRKLLQWMEAYHPDMIHLHNLHGYYIHIGLLFDYIKKHKKKILWTLHDCWAYTGHSAYCDGCSCEKWITGCGHCPQKSVYPKSYFDQSKKNWVEKKKIFGGVDDLTIITPSEWLASNVKKSFLGEYPVEVIHNGIHTDIFYPAQSTWKETHGIKGRMILGVASIWSDMKGIWDFNQLANEVDEGCQIVLVGKMSKKVKRKLNPKIYHVPKTDSMEEMASIYQAADWFVNLTYCDTYPTVNLEAVACGTDLITYDVGGSAESALAYGRRVVERGNIGQVVAEIDKGIVFSKEMDFFELDQRNCIEAYMELYRGYFLEKEDV